MLLLTVFSGSGLDGCRFLCPFHSVDGLVDELASQDPALQLCPQQAALPLRALHEAAVLLSAAGQVGDDFIHGAVGDVLVDRETRLTCLRRSKRRCQSGGRRASPPTSGTLHRVLRRRLWRANIVSRMLRWMTFFFISEKPITSPLHNSLHASEKWGRSIDAGFVKGTNHLQRWLTVSKNDQRWQDLLGLRPNRPVEREKGGQRVCLKW